MNPLRKIWQGLMAPTSFMSATVSSIRDRQREIRELMARSEQHRPRFPPEPIYREFGATNNKQWYAVEVYLYEGEAVKREIEQKAEVAGLRSRIFRIVVPPPLNFKPLSPGFRGTVIRREYILIEMELDVAIEHFLDSIWYIIGIATAADIDQHKRLARVDLLALIPPDDAPL